MHRSIYVLMVIVFIFPTDPWASHKPVSKEALVHIVSSLFEGVGGIETFLLMLKIEDAKSDEDLDLIYKTIGVDGEKVDIALKGVSIATSLFNSGFPADEAVLITKETQKVKPKMEEPTAILTFWLGRNGIKADSTQVAKALRQGELLKHMELDPRAAFEEISSPVKIIRDLR